MQHIEEAVLFGAKILPGPSGRKYEGWFNGHCRKVLNERAKKKFKMITQNSQRSKVVFPESRR